MYTKKYKILLREILKDLIKWKESHAHGWDDLILLRWKYSLQSNLEIQYNP